MNVTKLTRELIDERDILKTRLRRVESALRAIEQLNDTDSASTAAPERVPQGTMRQRVLDLFAANPGNWMRPKTVAGMIGHDNNLTVGACLSQLRRHGLLDYSQPRGYSHPTVQGDYGDRGLSAGTPQN